MNTQVTNAVQTTLKGTNDGDPTKLNGKTLGEVLKDLDKSDLKQAYTLMDEAYDIQYGKDGIEDTTNKLTTLQGKVGEKVYAIAKIAMEHCAGKLAIARSYFLALCDQAERHKENWYVKKHGEEQAIGKLIPMWAQYKSSIGKGMELEMNPLSIMEGTTDSPQWATASQYRSEVNKRVASTGSQAGNERNTSGQVATQLQLVAKGWSPKLQASMEVLCTVLNQLTHEEQDTFAPGILNIANEVQLELNLRRKETSVPSGEIVTDANGKVIGTSSSTPEVSEETATELSDAIGSQAAAEERAKAATASKVEERRQSRRASRRAQEA
jgi:hypothetical protein